MIVSGLLKGFFWKYVKVRMSFGKLILIKVRSSLRDYFVIGKEEEGFLIFKYNGKMKDPIRLNLTITNESVAQDEQGNAYRLTTKQKEPAIYRCLGVQWVDVDEEKNAISKTDYTAVSGYDAVKITNLIKRALMNPTTLSGQERLMIIILIVLAILVIGAIYMSYINYNLTRSLASNVSIVVQASKGNIISSAGVI
jgi:hypothetical protein